eukprot:gnl/MRDRNA2_/MRDRNA2_66594_c0_seq1.p1 gnl/MRDRNA2_/MRDRNA2_66594_c0~~gnl/MRDRNA2_/MRDRNA2_66594_c0_seq1.p1  ORF type:complete len:199 (+),score=32.22 gnl/MRDRNA2_/MRDRNA2_66594_c0_seq1:280-876(+)
MELTNKTPKGPPSEIADLANRQLDEISSEEAAMWAVNRLGMPPEVGQAIVDQEIDGQELLFLTADVLPRIGIRTLGKQQRFMRNLDSLRSYWTRATPGKVPILGHSMTQNTLLSGSSATVKAVSHKNVRTPHGSPGGKDSPLPNKACWVPRKAGHVHPSSSKISASCTEQFPASSAGTNSDDNHRVDDDNNDASMQWV